MADPDRLSRDLRQRRDDLQSELERLTEPPKQGTGVGFGKRVGDGTTEAVERLATTATARSIYASIQDIDRALTHIDDGSYGVCEECGESIGEARLEALPSSVLCIACARRA